MDGGGRDRAGRGLLKWCGKGNWKEGMGDEVNVGIEDSDLEVSALDENTDCYIPSSLLCCDS